MKQQEHQATTRRSGEGIPAAKVLLRDQAYRQLKQLIQSGTIAAGAFLSERHLVERLAMSKTPIRAALHQLEVEGLVKVSPQQGILVCKLSAREMVELFDLRTALEPFIVRRLAGRVSREQARRLEVNLEAQEKAAIAVDPVATAGLDVEFHQLLAEYLDNREILHPLEKALAKLYRDIVYISRNAEGRLLASYREHAKIAEAVLRPDPDEAARRMEEHLRFGRQFLVG
jgi:DNA-binding GntR family transcriptional regulator